MKWRKALSVLATAFAAVSSVAVLRRALRGGEPAEIGTSTHHVRPGRRCAGNPRQSSRKQWARPAKYPAVMTGARHQSTGRSQLMAGAPPEVISGVLTVLALAGGLFLAADAVQRSETPDFGAPYPASVNFLVENASGVDGASIDVEMHGSGSLNIYLELPRAVEVTVDAEGCETSAPVVTSRRVDVFCGPDTAMVTRNGVTSIALPDVVVADIMSVAQYTYKYTVYLEQRELELERASPPPDEPQEAPWVYSWTDKGIPKARFQDS